MGDRRWETDIDSCIIAVTKILTGDGRWETGDGRWETGDWTRETGSGRNFRDTGETDRILYTLNVFIIKQNKLKE